MFTTNAQTDESESGASLSQAQYARRDWYGEDESDDANGSEDDPDVLGHDPNGNAVTQQKIESLAHLWLKQTSEEPLLDPVALCEPPENGMHEREGVAVDLTDPEVYPPTAVSLATPREHMEKKAPSSRRWRFSEEYGHLTYGGIIPNRPKEKFLGLVKYVTANIRAVEVPPRNQRTILQGARTLKERGEKNDVKIMQRVAEWIFLPNLLFKDEKRGFKRY